MRSVWAHGNKTPSRMAFNVPGLYGHRLHHTDLRVLLEGTLHSWKVTVCTDCGGRQKSSWPQGFSMWFWRSGSRRAVSVTIFQRSLCSCSCSVLSDIGSGYVLLLYCWQIDKTFRDLREIVKKREERKVCIFTSREEIDCPILLLTEATKELCSLFSLYRWTLISLLASLRRRGNWENFKVVNDMMQECYHPAGEACHEEPLGSDLRSVEELG